MAAQKLEVSKITEIEVVKCIGVYKAINKVCELYFSSPFGIRPNFPKAFFLDCP